MSLVGADGGMDLYDGTLRAIDAAGAPIFEGARRPSTATISSRRCVVELMNSRISVARPGARCTGSPLAQLNCCSHIGTPLAEIARREFMLMGMAVRSRDPPYHWAASSA